MSALALPDASRATWLCTEIRAGSSSGENSASSTPMTTKAVPMLTRASAGSQPGRKAA